MKKELELLCNQRDFFGAEKYKEYCDDAIQDIPMLAKHIAEKLRDNDGVFLF